VKEARFILQGGLGNQLFIWAAAQFYLGKRQGVEGIEIVVSNLERAGTPRKLEIDKFSLSNKVTFLEFTPRHHLILRVTRKILAILKIQKNPFLGLYTSKVAGFDDSLEEKIPKSRFVIGYFQSQMYLKNAYVENQLKSISLNSPSQNYMNLLQAIRKQPSIVIHVRRGDYLKYVEEFGVLDARFFVNSIKSIPRWEEFSVWIFSDEQNIQVEFENYFPGARYVLETHGLNPAETLLLMSAGEHIVISNSSFSWWAAYLMKLNVKESQVIAPTPWSKSGGDPKSIIPADWVKVPAIWLGRMT
jgi:hypothetical protein